MRLKVFFMKNEVPINRINVNYQWLKRWERYWVYLLHATYTNPSKWTTYNFMVLETAKFLYPLYSWNLTKKKKTAHSMLTKKHRNNYSKIWLHKWQQNSDRSAFSKLITKPEVWKTWKTSVAITFMKISGQSGGPTCVLRINAFFQAISLATGHFCWFCQKWHVKQVE